MRFERLDLNLLVALDALIEDRSVSSAAKRLYLSQPALSGALNRLREFFGDDLLVPSGRQMILTPKAEELRAPVRDALMLIRSRITTPAHFDPATSQRQFAIAASDYAYNVLIADLMARASRLAPEITFELIATGPGALDRLERGELDLFVTIDGYLNPDHPQQALFEDEHALICWSGSSHAAGISESAFLHASHVVAFFGPERFPAFTESYFAQHGIDRRIEVRLSSFASMPQAVIGTERLATMYRRHAEYFAKILPITVHQPPVFLPSIREAAQWHSARRSDEGLKWLLGIAADCAAALNPPVVTNSSH